MAIRAYCVDCCRPLCGRVAPLRRRMAFLAIVSACSLAGMAVSLRYTDTFSRNVAESASESVVAWASAAVAAAGRPLRGVGFGGGGGGGGYSAVTTVPLLQQVSRPAVFEQDHVGCMRFQWQLLSRHRTDSGDMTPNKCVRLCRERDYDYAALIGGSTCHCSAWTGAGQLQLPMAGGARRCGAPCAGDPVLSCGGGGEYADVYNTRHDGGGDQDSSDEAHSWTTWMTTASRLSKGAVGTEYASRYRECHRSPKASHLASTMTAAAETAHHCVTAVQRRMGGRANGRGQAAATAAVLRAELDRYVGCFVFGSEPAATEAPIADGSLSGGGRGFAPPLVCSSLCAARPAAYALVTAHDGRCRCANSLGVARPFYRCGTTPPGVAVYIAAASPATSLRGVDGEKGSMQLTFDTPPRYRRKVLLLVHGGGSRSLLLNRLLAADERATHAVEPERTVFGDIADASGSATARSSMSRLLSRHLNCDAQRLPATWLAAIDAPKSAYELCRRHHAASGEPCMAAYRAACEASAIVSASSALLADAAALRQFVADNNDTTVFLVARDPLAIAALLKKSLLRGGRSGGRGAARITASRAAALCLTLKQTRVAAVQLAHGGSVVHRVHFEDADDEVEAVALGFYRRIRLFCGGGTGGACSYEAPESDERERVLRLAAHLVNQTKKGAIAAAAGGGATRREPAAADDALPALSAQEQKVVEEACAGFVYGE